MSAISNQELQKHPILTTLSELFRREIVSFDDCIDFMSKAGEKEWSQVIPLKVELKQLVDANQRSLLMGAIKIGDVVLARKLIDKEIYDYSLRDIKGNTPLHYAAKFGNVDLLGTLWTGNDIDAQNNHQKTPLHQAIKAGQIENVQALIDNGASLTVPFNYKGLKLTPLQYAAVRGEVECFDILAKEAAFRAISIADQTSAIGSLLHLAVHFQQNTMLDHLLKTYPEETKTLLESKDSQGHTPFAYATHVNNHEALSLLQLRGANIETENNLRQRPLHLAAQNEDSFLIEYLVFLGCVLDPVDQHNQRPIDLATGVQKTLLSNLMKQHRNLQERPPQYRYAPPLNLVFKGGGPKGIAYLGVLRGLEEKNVLSGVVRVAGTSAGAINSTLLAFNFTLNETEKLLRETNLKSFLDHPLTKARLKEAIKKNATIGGAFRALKAIRQAFTSPATLATDTIKKMFSALWRCTGVCKGEVFRKWIETQIQSKTGIQYCTYGELRQFIHKGKPFKHLHVFASCLSPSQIEHFNSEDPKWDDVIISDTVRASMSIPGVFIPHIIHRKIGGERKAWLELGQFIDGGLLYNLPIEVFDEKQYIQRGVAKDEMRCPMFNKRTLGFSLFTAESKAPEMKEIDTVGQLLKSIVSFYMEAETMLRQRNPYNQHRIIEIDNKGVGTLDFNLSDERKNDLIGSGLKAVQDFYIQFGSSEKTASLFYHPRLEKQVRNALSLAQKHPFFTGRKEELQEMEELLGKHDRVTLYGLPGVGKTELAISYANEYIEAYSLIWVIPCHTEEEKLSAYMGLASSLRLSYRPGERSEDLVRKVHQELENYKNSKPWFLIYDNWTPGQGIPARGGKIVFTSFAKNPSHPSLELEPISPEEAIELMTKLTGEPSSNDLHSLVKLCGYYPFVLVRIGNDIRRIPGMTIQSCVKALLEEKQPLLDLPGDDRYSKTIDQTVQRLASCLSRETQTWMQACYYLHPKQVPLTFIHSWLQIQHSEGNLRRLQNDILKTVSEYAIQTMYDGFLSMNPLFHRAIRLTLTDPEKIATSVAKMLVKEVQWDFDKTTKWNEDIKNATIWSEHALVFSSNQEVFKTVSPMLQMSILFRLGEVKEQLYKLEEALTFYQRALVLQQNQDPQKVKTFESMAQCCDSLNRKEEAARYLQQAQLLRQKKPLDQANDLLGQARAENNKGNIEQALHLCLEALIIYQQVDPNTVKVAEICFLIGQCYEMNDSSNQAREYYQKAYTLAHRIVGDLHPTTKKFYSFFKRLSKK